MQPEGLKKLAEFRMAEKRLRLASGLANWLTHALFIVLALVLFQSLISLTPSVRYLLLAAALLLLVWSYAWNVHRPLWARLFKPDQPSLNSLALRIGSAYPHLQDRLANALQIADLKEGESAALSPALIQAAKETIAPLLAQIDFSSHLNRAPLRSGRRRLLAALAIVLLSGLLFPRTLSVGLERLLYPQRDLSRQLSRIFAVIPGDSTVLRGESVAIHAWTGTFLMDGLQIGIERPGSREILPMTRGANDTFHYILPALRDSLYYQIRYQKAASRKYLLRVVDLPMVRSLQLKVQPPAYSGAEAFLLEENIGDVNALKGSRVEWRAEANKAIMQGQLLFSSGRTEALSIAEKTLFAGFPLLSEETYFSELTDKAGLGSANPITYHLRLIPDQDPFVRVVAPGRDIDLKDDMQLPLLIQAQDDYGLSRMRIAYQVTAERAAEIDSSRFVWQEIPLSAPARALWNVAFSWNLSSSPLLPNEVLLYYIQVLDNDAVSGPKAARTALFRARFPSIYELFKEVNKSQDETIVEMEKNYEKSRDLKEKVDDLAMQMKRANELSWQKKQEIDDALKQQQAVQQNLEKLSERLDEMIQRMDERQLLSPETMRKYEELQELYRDIMTPELQKSMEKVAEAMQKMDPVQLQKALEELKLSEEALNRNLDRTLSLLKRLKTEQQLDQAIRMLEELQERQQKVTEQALQDEPGRMKNLEEEQKGMQKEIGEMPARLDSLQQQMAEQPGMPEEQVAAARDELKKANFDKQMEAMQQAMQQGNSRQMKSNSDQIQSGLQKAKDQLQQAKDALSGEMARRAMQAMQQGMRNLLALSQMQENVLRDSENTPETSARVPETAVRQQQLTSSLERVINDLYSASKESFGISPRIGKPLGEAQQAMQQALDALESRNLGQANDKQGQAMAGLNESVMELDAAMQSMMQGGGSGMSMSEFMQQMQGLANGQQGINAQTLGLGGMQQGMSLAQQAAVSRLAQAQGQVRKSLEELAAEAAGLSDVLGDLDRVVEEMKQVETDLNQHTVNRQTIERQNRILSRMLDSQKSMREREHSKERRAETGKSYHPASPAELPMDLGQRRDQLQQDLLRAKEEGFARDYLELIKKYYESIGQHEKPQ